MCLSVKSHLTSGASVRPENTVTYSAGKGGKNGVFSETAPLRRSSIRSVGHFPAESVHAYYSIKGHEYPRRGFCPLVHPLCFDVTEVANSFRDTIYIS